MYTDGHILSLHDAQPIYCLHAKSVRDLTGTFLAHLDEQMAKRGRRFLPTLRRRPGKINGFVLDRGRLALPVDDFFQQDPVRLLEIFELADRRSEEHTFELQSLLRLSYSYLCLIKQLISFTSIDTIL